MGGGGREILGEGLEEEPEEGVCAASGRGGAGEGLPGKYRGQNAVETAGGGGGGGGSVVKFL